MNADQRGGIHGFSLLCAGSCGGLIPCTQLTQPFRRVTKVPEGFGVPQGLVQVLISPRSRSTNGLSERCFLQTTPSAVTAGLRPGGAWDTPRLLRQLSLLIAS